MILTKTSARAKLFGVEVEMAKLAIFASTLWFVATGELNILTGMVGIAVNFGIAYHYTMKDPDIIWIRRAKSKFKRQRSASGAPGSWYQ